MSQFDDPPEIVLGLPPSNWFDVHWPTYRSNIIPFTFRNNTDYDAIHDGLNAVHPFKDDTYYYLTHYKIQDPDFIRDTLSLSNNHPPHLQHCDVWSADYSRHSLSTGRVLFFWVPFTYYYIYSSTQVRSNLATGQLDTRKLTFYEEPDGWFSSRTTADVDGNQTPSFLLRREIYGGAAWVPYDARIAWGLKPQKPDIRWALLGYQKSGVAGEWGYRNIMVCEANRSLCGGFWQHSETVGPEIESGLWGIASGALRTYLCESASRVSGFNRFRGVFFRQGKSQAATRILVGPHPGCVNVSGILGIFHKGKDWTGEDAYFLMPMPDHNPMAYSPNSRVGEHWDTLFNHPSRGGRNLSASIDYRNFNDALYYTGDSTYDVYRNKHYRGGLCIRKNPSEGNRWQLWYPNTNTTQQTSEIFGVWFWYTNAADPAIADSEWFTSTGSPAAKSLAWNQVPFARPVGAIADQSSLALAQYGVSSEFSAHPYAGFTSTYTVPALSGDFGDGAKRVLFLPCAFSYVCDYSPLWSQPFILPHWGNSAPSLAAYAKPIHHSLIPFPDRSAYPMAVSLHRADISSARLYRVGDSPGDFLVNEDSGYEGELALGINPWLDEDGHIRDPAVYTGSSDRWGTHIANKRLYTAQGFAVASEVTEEWIPLWKLVADDYDEWLDEWETGWGDGLDAALSPPEIPTHSSCGVHSYEEPRNDNATAIAKAYDWGYYWGLNGAYEWWAALESINGFLDGYSQGWSDADTGTPYDPTPPTGTVPYQEAWVPGYNAGYNDHPTDEPIVALEAYNLILYEIDIGLITTEWELIDRRYDAIYGEAVAYWRLRSYQTPNGLVSFDGKTYEESWGSMTAVSVEREVSTIPGTFRHNIGARTYDWTEGFIYTSFGSSQVNTSDVKAQTFNRYTLSASFVVEETPSAIGPLFSSPAGADVQRAIHWAQTWIDHGRWSWPNSRYSVDRVEGVDSTLFPFRPGIIRKIV